MLFHKESKVAFLLNPRSGSTSIKEYLSSIGFIYPLIRSNQEPFFKWHPTHEECVSTYQALNEYKIYSVFRDPIDRFLSGLRFVSSIDGLGLSKAKSYDRIVEKLFSWNPAAKLSGIPSEIFTNQVSWVSGENVEIIPYVGFAVRVQELTSSINVSGKSISRYNVSTGKNFGVPSDDVIEFAYERFSRDYSFGREAGLLV
jgi:hypothetical protein